MAKILEAFEFKNRVGFGEKIYDWNELLDGQIRELVQGEDFTCNTQSLRMMSYKQAEKRDLGVRVSVTAEKDGEPATLTLQAYTMTDEEREQKKANRAALSASKKAAKDDSDPSPEEDEAVGIEEQQLEEGVIPEPEPVPEPPKPVVPPKKNDHRKRK